MTLEIIEQALFLSDSRFFLRGIEGIWEPEIHTLRLCLTKDSKVDLDNSGNVIFPLIINYTLDDEEIYHPLIKLTPDTSDLVRPWNLSKSEGVKHIVDVVFPDSVVADIVPDTLSSNNLRYLERTGRLICGNYFDLLSDKEISRFADKESWYRYVRVSSDQNFTSAQHIDKDGKIISQEYIYYRYTGLKAFFDGGNSRYFDLNPDTLYVRLSGYAEREKYYVKGDTHTLISKEIVHIKEVPGLEINPRNKDRKSFSDRFNYSSFTLYTGHEDEEEPFIEDSPKSFNFIAYTDEGEKLVSNNLIFSSGNVIGDVWEFLEASTDLEYRINENPVFFISGGSKISFTLWNAFRENVSYSTDNVKLEGDISNYFNLKLQYWTNDWVGPDDTTKRGVLEVNLVPKTIEELNGTLILMDTEDETEIARIEVRTLKNKVQDRIYLGTTEGTEFGGIHSENSSGSETVYMFGASNKYDTLNAKFLKLWDLDNGYVRYQSRQATVECSQIDSVSVVNAKDAIFLADTEEEINISQYPGRNIILYRNQTYYFINPPGGFIYEAGDSSFVLDTNQKYSKLEVSAGDEKELTYYLSGLNDNRSITKIYFIDKTPGTGITLTYEGIRQQEDEKLLFGYLLVGFNLETAKTTLETAKLFPVYLLPNLSFGCNIYTLYDRNYAASSEIDEAPEVSNIVNSYSADIRRNLILGTGKTWVDFELPLGYYIGPDGEKIFKTYRINPVTKTSSPENIIFDSEKWRELYGSDNYINASVVSWNGSTYSRPWIKIPVIIKSLPTGSDIKTVSVRVNIGEVFNLTGTYVDIEFNLGQEAKAITLEDTDAINGNVIIYETPANTFVPGKVYSKYTTNQSGAVSYGPAFATTEYSEYEVKSSKFYSISELSEGNASIYSGNILRAGGVDTFNFLSTRQDVEAVKLVKTRNEYNDPMHKSKYVPETREYEVIYKLTKLDDLFPQYPAEKLTIKSGSIVKDIFIFYMPRNPYILGTAAKKEYLVITREQRAAWDNYINNPGSVSKPAYISGSFSLSSDLFNITNGFDFNASSAETNLSTRTGRYLYHYNGLLKNVEDGDVYKTEKAFHSLTVTPQSLGTSLTVNYEFDPSLWSGSESSTIENYVAELFVRVPSSARKSIFGDVQPIIGFTPTWNYPQSDYQVTVWNENYEHTDSNFSGVPGAQRRPDVIPYIKLEEENLGEWSQDSYVTLRCQIRATSNSMLEEEDISVSCYDSTYHWSLPGSYSRDNFSSTDSSIARIDSMYDWNGNTRFVISVLPNIKRTQYTISSPITDDIYKTRSCSIYETTEGSISLNIEQQPTESYFYYRTDRQGSVAKICSACQTSKDDPVLSDSYNLSSAGNTITIYFEYLETADIANFMHYYNDVDFGNYLQWGDRERIDWTNSELGVEVFGDLDLNYNIDTAGQDSTLGRVGKIVLTIGENTAETSRAGVFRIYRRDNAASLVELSIDQAGINIVSLSSGSINSAGDGRMWILSDYPANTMTISGPSECIYLGEYVLDNDVMAQAYSIKFPANSIPRLLGKTITVTSSDVPDRSTTLVIPQGYFGMKMRKEDLNWSEATENGLYVFGRDGGMEDLNTRYYFCHTRLEPTINDEFGQELEVAFDLNTVEIDNIKYQIVGSGDKEYEVSEVFTSVSTDIVFGGTIVDIYPYIHTIGTIYEDKKDLGLGLVVEFDLCKTYTSEFTDYSYYRNSRSYHQSETYSSEAKVINKIQIWYKI